MGDLPVMGKKEDRRALLGIWVLYTLSLSSLLRAAVHYKDDAGRAMEGYRRWYQSSRYVSDVLSVILHAGRRLGDMAPLGQLLAVFIMAASSVCLIRIFTEKPIGWREAAAAAPLALSPYFLECFSFQYDSPYMALSVLVCLLPFFFRKRGIRAYALTSVICLILMCMLYQTSSGIYPLVVLFLVFTEWNRGEKSLKEGTAFALESALCYVFSLIFYRVALVSALPFYSEASLPPLKQLPFHFLKRYLFFYWRIIRDLKTGWLVLIAILAAAWWLHMTFSSARRRAAAFFMAGAVLMAGSAFAGGVYLFFQENLTQPRMMFGFGVFLALLGVTLVSGEKGPAAGWLYPGLCAALSWCFFTFALIYGNALAEQQRYSQLVTGILLSDISELDMMKNGEEKELILSGDLGMAPAVQNACSGNMMLFRLLHSTLGEYRWAEYSLRRSYAVPDLVKAKEGADAQRYPVLSENAYYTIRGDETHLAVVFPSAWSSQKPDNGPVARRLEGLAGKFGGEADEDGDAAPVAAALEEK